MKVKRSEKYNDGNKCKYIRHHSKYKQSKMPVNRVIKRLNFKSLGK